MDNSICFRCGDSYNSSQVIRGVCLFCSAAARLNKKTKDSKSSTVGTAELSSGDIVCNLRLTPPTSPTIRGYFDLVTTSGIKISDFKIIDGKYEVFLSSPRIKVNKEYKDIIKLPQELKKELNELLRVTIDSNRQIPKSA